MHRVPVALILLLLGACTPAHLPDDGAGGGGDGGVRPSVCGDDYVNGEAGELCDDGNTDDGDGCDSECQPEIPDTCGNNVLDDGEECDDNNNVGGDGCGAGCWVEQCGNDYLDEGEACEDGNTVGGDGCSADCKSDETCGNGIEDPGEMCDDGDGDNEDECPETCQPAECGDGFVQAGVESCDDGNDVAGDGCTECILDSCGNNELDEGEECDLGAGNGMPGTTCFKNCLKTDLEPGDVQEISLDPTQNWSPLLVFAEAADLNDDGKQDLFIVDENNIALTQAIGLGDGRMAVDRPSLGSGGSARDFLLVDVDGDGLEDALTVTTGNDLQVYLGNGTDFDRASSFTTLLDIGGQAPFDLAVADLNGDGELDVATANNTTSDVTILLGDGAGNFTATTRLATTVGETGTSPRSIAIGDVNDDDILDIVTANVSTDDVSLFAGMGNGQFGSAENFTLRVGAGGDSPVDLVVTDVTNDGIDDVVVACSGSDDAIVLAADEGSLAAPVRFPILVGEQGDSPRALFVGDVTQDGVPDIVTANSSSGDVAILRGLGPGVAFGSPEFLAVRDETTGFGQNPIDIAVGDVNGDNIPDITTTNSSGLDMAVLLGEGDGDFAVVKHYAINRNIIGGSPVRGDLADTNGDGTLDMVALFSNGVTVMPGLGDGRLANPQTEFTNGNARNAASADMNGDGTLDIVLSGSQRVDTWQQQADGSLVVTGGPTLSFTPSFVDLGDLDGEAGVDVAALSGSNFSILTNDGSGTLTNQQNTGLAASGQECRLGEVTGDNALDIIIPGSPNSLYIGAGNGKGSMATPVGISTASGSSGQNPVDVAVGDLNGDGENDLVSANRNSNDLSVLLGEGGGTFSDPIIVPAVFGADAATIESVRIGDFNGDGFLDLAASNPARGSVSVMLGFGDGGFAAPQAYEVSGRPHWIAVGDFNGDGVDDLAAVGNESGFITTLTGFAVP